MANIIRTEWDRCEAETHQADWDGHVSSCCLYSPPVSSDTKSHANSVKPWSCGSVGWSIIPYTNRFRAPFQVILKFLLNKKLKTKNLGQEPCLTRQPEMPRVSRKSRGQNGNKLCELGFVLCAIHPMWAFLHPFPFAFPSWLHQDRIFVTEQPRSIRVF